jgi:tetratricopeptide (TPR) repeat protein
LFHAAVEHFQQAIEIEPEWGEPYAEIAVAYEWLCAFGGSDVQAEFYPKAKQTALEALALDDTLSRAHSILGDVLLAREWDWAAAEQENLRALELDPNHASWDYARFLRYAGRHQEAIEQYKRTRERYPTSPLLRFRVGHVQLCAGRSEEAETEAERLIEDFPDSDHGYHLLGLTYLATSRYEEASTILEKARDEVAPWMPVFRSQVLPLALVKAGRVEEAREILRELETSGRDYWLVDLYMALGQEDKAMAQIEAAFAVRRNVLLTLRCSPEFDRLMEIPRFQEIVEAIGFPN